MSLIESSKVVRWVLWFVVFCGSAYLALRRYELFEHVVPRGTTGPGNDFWQFLHASRLIDAGKSPYDVSTLTHNSGYVYTPLIALAFLPFAHADTVHIWHVFTALSIAAVIVFASLVSFVEVPILPRWLRPLLFGFTIFTALQFMPTTVEFNSGQVDTFVLVMLAFAVLATVRGRAATTGVFIGLGALIKTWPAGVGLTLLGRGYASRQRALVGFIVVLLVGPVLAIGVGGISGLWDFLKVTVDSRTQHLISLSVWGVPKLLFSASKLARPLFVSTPIEFLAMLIFFAWVVGLLVLVVHYGESSSLSFWNVTACVVLLLPVSHLNYTMYFLPLLWIWAARWLVAPRIDDRLFAVMILIGLWWLVTFNWPVDDSATASSLHVSVIFFGNLAAVTISVIGDRLQKVPLKRSV